MKSVIAVIVTYNRLELLKKCIEKLRTQTVQCDYMLIDNASTDGTCEWAHQQTDIQYYNTETNIGGAGGFNLGMRHAAELGYEWIWIMDDDTLPDPNALEILLEADRVLNGNYGWLSSKCLWTDGTLCPMNLQRISPYREITIAEGTREYLPAQMASFVSLFLRKGTVLKYGVPIRDFFIWVDDWEYTRRISMEQKCYVITGSVVVHAMRNNSIVNIATDSPERLPRYRYFYRNDVYLYRREGLLGWIWVIMKDVWHCVQVLLYARTGKAKRMAVILKGFWNGIHFRPSLDELDAPGQ